MFLRRISVWRSVGPPMRVRPHRTLVPRLCLSFLCLTLNTAHADQAGDVTPAISRERQAQYDADSAKTILDLQQFRRIETIAVQGADMRPGTATLVNLNPDINAWFLLTLDWGGADGRVSYHIENPRPKGQTLHLAGDDRSGLAIFDGENKAACELWSGNPSMLERARKSPLPYAPLCDGHLYLRNRVAGHRTELESVTSFLRDNVWKGEAIVGFVRDHFYQDAFRETGRMTKAADAPGSQTTGPLPASVKPAYGDVAVVPQDLGIDVAGPPSRQLGIGRWYPVRNVDGVYVSLMQPQAAGDEIAKGDKGTVSGLDSIEASALDYLVAFDLSQFDLGFALGTDHPRLGWSPRPPSMARNDRLPGPDGIGTAAPLVTTGMVSPAVLRRVVAAFIGGFKRHHGAFKYGDLAKINHGSHYGFIEEGVVFSKLQPGLATLYVLDDGSVHMKSWAGSDNALLGRIKFARQNGVALVVRDPNTGAAMPGALVAKWGPGNWSGSADEELRTLRAGACLQEAGGKSFLIYGYFSTATPSAMTRVFQAYRCSYAMLLDMNALEHTYLAVYVRHGSKVGVEHLIAGMNAIDKTSGGQLIPRFIGFPDNRDFFYLIRRRSGP